MRFAGTLRVLLIAAAGALTGCGQAGPLVLPESPRVQSDAQPRDDELGALPTAAPEARADDETPQATDPVAPAPSERR